ncbi:MAG: hypothetical protein U0441_21930 [Polyangiaceae bacterium]
MRTRALVVPGLFATSILGAGGCAVPAVFQPDEPPRPPRVVEAPREMAPPPAPHKRVRLLWRGTVPVERWLATGIPGMGTTTHYLSTLLGVDRKNEHAYFFRSPLGDEDWYEIVKVPLSEEAPDQEPTVRWIGKRGVKYGDFSAFDGDARENLLRYAAMIEDTGPFVTRSRGGEEGPTVAVSRDALLYEGTHDEVFVADRQGGHARKIMSLAAAYNPLFSADGKTAAFTGCHHVSPPPGKMTQCEYHLYITDVGDKKPARIAEAIDPQAPVFSPDGRYVYTVSRDGNYLEMPFDRAGCLFRVDAAPPHAAKKLACLDRHHDVTFTLDPSGKTAVIEGSRIDSKDYLQDVRWLSLPEGEALGSAEIERGSAYGTLGAGGLYVTRGMRGFAFADLAKGKVVVGEEPRDTFTVLSHHFAADGALYAIRQRNGKKPVEEIVAIDLRAEIDAHD